MASASLTLGHHGRPITVTIHGRVVDEFGEGIAGAGVSVLRGGQALKNTQSGQLGQFEVHNLETKIGFHEVRAAHLGWRPSKEQLPITREDEGKFNCDCAKTPSERSGVLWRVGEVIFGGGPRKKEEQDEEEEVVQYIEPDKEVRVEPEKPYEEVRVFFATDRNRQLQRGNVDPKKFFGNGRSPTATISFGYCNVSIPAQHQIGKITRGLERLERT